jgi:hypothetical protein
MLKKPVVKHRLRELVQDTIIIKIVEEGALRSAVELFGQSRILGIEKEPLNLYFRHLILPYRRRPPSLYLRSSFIEYTRSSRPRRQP